MHSEERPGGTRECGTGRGRLGVSRTIGYGIVGIKGSQGVLLLVQGFRGLLERVASGTGRGTDRIGRIEAFILNNLHQLSGGWVYSARCS